MNIPRSIARALQSIVESDFIEPELEVDPTNEIVVGVMPPDLRRLYTLGIRYDDMASQVEQAMNESLVEEERRKAQYTGFMYTSLSGIVWKMLIVGVIEHFHLWEGASDLTLSFRKGWQVIQRRSDNVFTLPVLKVGELSHPPSRQ